MRILFCKISSMKYYKGHCDEDVPVQRWKICGQNMAMGMRSTILHRFWSRESQKRSAWDLWSQSPTPVPGTPFILKIDGCANLKNEPFVEDVLVIWCATRLQGDVTVSRLVQTRDSLARSAKAGRLSGTMVKKSVFKMSGQKPQTALCSRSVSVTGTFGRFLRRSARKPMVSASRWSGIRLNQKRSHLYPAW